MGTEGLFFNQLILPKIHIMMVEDTKNWLKNNPSVPDFQLLFLKF